MVSVRVSALHGQGLFATRFIPAGTLIGHLEGRFTRCDGPHVLWLDDRWGLRVSNELRFINHSSRPNAVYYDDLTVEALRNIHPGEEITHDYSGDERSELPDFAA